jgi:hypothetical protein
VLELAKVIKDLRAELEDAIIAADGEALLFELGPTELELSVAIEAGAHADAKARFWVMDAGAGANVNHSNTQRIKLTLTPRLGPDGATPYVSGTVDERRR